MGYQGTGRTGGRWTRTTSWPLLLCVGVLGLFGCSSTYANRTPLGETLPDLSGNNLEGGTQTFPEATAGRHAILLVGYEQNSQFDIDRWLVGLHDSGVTTPIYEVPTVVGMMPGLFANTIDKGMRSGIPAELWEGVVTLYDDDAKRLAMFLGNERPIAARVLLLDPKGQVVFFHDGGFSPSYLRQLTGLLDRSPAPDTTVPQT